MMERVQIGTRLLEQTGIFPDTPGVPASTVSANTVPANTVPANAGSASTRPASTRPAKAVPVTSGPATTGPAMTMAAAVPPQGTDGTLLAVVPIPGTGTSLAIVGYPVTTPGAPRGEVTEATDGDRSGLLLDHDQRRVWVDGAEVPLTFQEFELLAFLSAHPSTVFTRADLVRQVWQRDFAADSRTVDVHVSRLRHKLGPVYGRCLVTEYRIGYQFRPPAPAVP
ncbi:MAG: winged helix-turn-helix domain-containing protein [Nocardiopsaceae bacterium]|nr:winged helix-turn-helix domain-containing protein [Nocardiopsaceae bacterium]